MSLLGKPRRKPTWRDLGQRFDIAVPGSHHSTEDGPTWLAWHEGPSIASVQAAVGDIPGWEWRAVAPATQPALPPPGPGSIIWVRRSFEMTTLATAVVRYHGAYGRPFNSGDERGRQRLADLLDHDLPDGPRYPIVELVTRWLLESADPEPSTEPAASELDGLAQKLRHLGYDRLWAEAYKQVS